MTLDELLVCPVCHSELPLPMIWEHGKGTCPSCGRVFSHRDGIYHLTPIPPLDEDVLEKWAVWEKLQVNGLISYKVVPGASCSIAGRADVMAFKEFLALTPGSVVLDVGCGPLGLPKYLRGWPDVEVIGIDPLPSAVPLRGMGFVIGIGEYLPFRPRLFDSIILATTLDHVLSPERVLSEVQRCLKPAGRVLIWLGLATEEALAEEPLALSLKIRKAIGGRVSRFLMHLRGPSPKTEPASLPLPEPPPKRLWQQLRDSLDVPPGALDPYHLRYDDESELQRWCEHQKLEIVRREVYGEQNMFLELRHGRKVITQENLKEEVQHG